MPNENGTVRLNSSRITIIFETIELSVLWLKNKKKHLL